MEYVLPDAGNYPNVEVAGEAYREREITQALGRSPGIDEEIEATFKAHLIPEPDNPHDSSAISVRVNGHVIGYIERDQTAQFLGPIQRITASGHTATTQARIWAVRREGWDGSGVRFHSRVSVVLPWDGLTLPSNNPPAEPYSLLPWGSALQLTGEEEHFEHLGKYVPEGGKGLVVLTLHRIERALKNGATREIAEARIDGQRVGELSVASSKHFLPIIDHHAKSGLTVAAWGRVKGSALTAEVTVQGTKASELPSEWLNGAPSTLPALLPLAAQYQVPPAYIPQVPSPVAKAKPASRPAAKPAVQKSTAGCAPLIVGIAAVGVAVSSALNYLT